MSAKSVVIAILVVIALIVGFLLVVDAPLGELTGLHLAGFGIMLLAVAALLMVV